MFIALKEQRTAKGQRAPGSELPEAAEWDVTSVRNLVNAKAIEWRGDGGKYGPFTDAIKRLEVLESAAKPVVQTDDDMAPVPHHEFVAYRNMMLKETTGIIAQVEALAVRVGRVESRSEGSAPASNGPSPGKRGS